MAEKVNKIVEHIRSGKHNEAFREIYKKVLPTIRKYILSNSGTEEDVEDIFQDTMLIFYNQVHAGKFHAGKHVGPYLYKIASNLYINLVKKNNRMRKSTLTDVIEESDDYLNVMIAREKRLYLDKLWEQLGYNNRELLKLRMEENLSIKEISLKMGFSNEDVTKATIYRCKMRFINLVKTHSVYFD